MATVHKVKLPNGDIVKVKAPDDMPEQKVRELALKQAPKRQKKDDVSLAQKGAGYVGEIAIGEAGRIGATGAGAAIGTMIAPGIGTAIGAGIGYLAGGLGSGWLGSEFRQRQTRPDEELDRGEQARDALINLIPGSGLGKTIGKRLVSQAGASGAIGAGAEIADKIISEDRLPTAEELAMAGVSTAALGTAFGSTSELTGAFLQKYGGRPTTLLRSAIKRNDPTAIAVVDGVEKTAKQYSDDFAKTLQNAGLSLREQLDDEFIKLKVLQDQVAGNQIRQGGPFKVASDEMDYYMNRRLAEGKIDASLAAIDKLQDADVAILLEKSKSTGLSPAEISDRVNTYLASKHAIAFNKNQRKSFFDISGKKDGAAGISTEQAKFEIDDFESNGLADEFKDIIKIRKQMSNDILDVLVDGQVVSKAEAAKLRKQSPEYVPMQRIMDDDPIDDYTNIAFNGTNTSNFQVKNTGIRRAVGSDRSVDVGNLQNVIAQNLAGAVKRAEVNKANLAAVRLFRHNKELSGDMVEEVTEQAIGKKFGKAGEEGGVILKRQPDALVSFFEDGKRKYLRFKPGYEDLGAAMQGLNRAEVAGLFKGMTVFNKYLSGMYTRYSPDFFAPNAVRDRMEAMFNTAGAIKGKTNFDMVKNIGSEMNAIRRYAGVGKVKGKFGDTAEDRLYQEFIDAGGSAGGLSISTLKDLQKNIQKIGGDEGLIMAAKQKGKKFNEVVNGINMIFEDASRFSVYKTARNNGASKDQAAFAARNSSFDPRQRGTKTGILSSVYLFVNPAIQGSKNFTRTMFKNKKLAAKFGAGLIGTTAALDKFNQAFGGDNYRAEIPEWKRNKNFILVNPLNPRDEDDKTLNYFTIPIGYSMVPHKVAADYLQQYMRGNSEMNNPREAALQVAKEIGMSYNPLGGSADPALLRVGNELAQNENGLGQSIRPEHLERPKYDPSLRISDYDARSVQGEIAIATAEMAKDYGYSVSPANLIHIYETMTGGPGKTVERLFGIFSKIEKGEKILAGDIPILRRFYGESYEQKVGASLGDEKTIEELEKADGERYVLSSRYATDILLQLDGVTSADERKKIIRNGLNSIPEKHTSKHPNLKEKTFKRLQFKFEQAQKDQFMLDLKGTSPMARATYIREEINKLQTEEARKKFRQKMVEEGILTNTVYQELKALSN
jgi:predicted RNA-binding protein YlxR (DUF448 family)